jgi:predicted nucleic acid-binding protein
MPHGLSGAPVWIVADPNCVVSAFLWGGPPRKLLDVVRERGVRLCTSPMLIDELRDVLLAP